MCTNLVVADGTWPPFNPNWFKQQEMMAKLGPFLLMLAPAAPVVQVVAQAAAPKKEEVAAPKQPEKEVEVYLGRETMG